MDEIPEIMEEQKEPKKIPFKLQYRVKAIHGEYVVKRPLGQVGARHFALIAKCAPSRFDENGVPMYSPAQEDKAYEVFVEWVQKVLKYIIAEYPQINGIQIAFDTMPSEDQWSLFIAVSNMMDRGEELFRIIE